MACPVDATVPCAVESGCVTRSTAPVERICPLGALLVLSSSTQIVISISLPRSAGDHPGEVSVPLVGQLFAPPARRIVSRG